MTKFFTLIAHSLRDLFLGMLPPRTRGNGFAFLIHPRDISDVYRKYPFIKAAPDKLLLFFLKYYWPVVVSEVNGLFSVKTGKPVKGWVITIPLTARQMIEDRQRAVKKIIRAARLAENVGVGIMGLGALTASVSRGGLDLVDKVNINITTGHAYTGWTVTANFFKFAELVRVKKESIVVAIVGAAGSIGSLSAQIIARACFKKFILVDLERKRLLLDELVEKIKEINPKITLTVTHQIGSIKDADFIIAATSAPEAIIKPDDLREGAVVLDDAQPSDVDPEVLVRDDVLVINAGVVHTPGIRSHFNFGLADAHDNFCCMAEVLILAAQEWQDHFVIGRGADLKLVDYIAELAKDTNFRLAEPQNAYGLIPKAKIERVITIMRERKRLSA